MLDSSAKSLSVSDDFRLLTPERVRQRLKHMKYEGDPDLMPVTTYENGFLVTFLYHMSSKINEKVICRLIVSRYLLNNKDLF